jgi:hypothetical protein
MVYEAIEIGGFMRKNRIQLNIILFLATVLLSACNLSTDKNNHQLLTQQDNGWKIGAKIHFEEESGNDYIGLKQINALTKDALKSILHITKESGDNNAKILLKRENGDIQIDHYAEKSRPNVGEEMHATLLYTSPRGFHSSETLEQVCNVLFENCETPTDIETVSSRYSAIIKPYWRFKISEIVITKNDKGPLFIMAKLFFNNHENIYLKGKPISAGLHMTLVNCEDSSILSDPMVVDKLTKKLSKGLKGKFIKIAAKNGVADLEFGMSGQPWRIRSGQKIEFKKSK